MVSTTFRLKVLFTQGFNDGVFKKCRLTVASHAHGEALLQPAVLAPVPVVFGHLAVFAASALVAQLLSDRPLEEAFAPFAAHGAVVPT